MNRSKDLRKLFRESLKNARICSVSPTRTSPMYGGSYGREIHFNDNIKIFFYEWSDVMKAPRCFYSIDVFDNFLKTSGIYIPYFQREIIRNLGTVYICCYNGTRDLNIRGTYKGLCDSMNDFKNGLSSVPISRPKLVFEERNSVPQNDGTFFG